MNADLTHTITSEILKLQDNNHCWNVLASDEKNYPDLKHYSPVYKTTLWALILLADIKCKPDISRLQKPLDIISKHFFNKEHGIFTIGKSHFPIPCLNGNMLYLLQYFKCDTRNFTGSIIDFFSEYQRFDDGDFKTPSDFPYFSNRSCYGKHTCYWGVTKLLKGISFIPENKRSNKAKKLLRDCIDFVLLHEVCYSSHNENEFLHTNIKKLTFPNMYQSDFLEILWLLKRENIASSNVTKALKLLKSKMANDSTWMQERTMNNLIISMNSKKYGNPYITERAREVIEFYFEKSGGYI